MADALGLKVGRGELGEREAARAVTADRRLAAAAEAVAGERVRVLGR